MLALDGRVGAALVDDLAARQHRVAIRDGHGEADILLDQQDRRAVVALGAQDVGQSRDDRGLQPLGDLVDQHQRRPGHQRARHDQHFLLAAASAFPPFARRRCASTGKNAATRSSPGANRRAARPTRRFSSTVNSPKIA